MFSKQWFDDITRFTKADRIAAVVFVLAVGSSVTLPRLLAPDPPPLSAINDSVLVLAMDTLQQRQARKQSFKRPENEQAFPYQQSTGRGFRDGALFRFDPNTISIQDWQRLGLNEKTSKTILNYISKGGKFYKPEDLQKIWSMPEGFYERVKDYVAITPVKKSFQPFPESKQEFEREERKPVFININSADTTAFISLPGIGSKLSARIIGFREKLGGFYSIDQVGETYGLPDSTFRKIKGRLQVNVDAIRKININTATKDELKVHPYIKWHLANAIVEYRSQHGNFRTLEDLKNIVLVDEATFLKVTPYLAIN